MNIKWDERGVFSAFSTFLLVNQDDGRVIGRVQETAEDLFEARLMWFPDCSAKNLGEFINAQSARAAVEKAALAMEHSQKTIKAVQKMAESC